MKTYWILLLIMLFVNILPIKNKQIRLFISFIPFFLYGALRINYGLDYDKYEIAFENVHNYGVILDEHQEIGYQYLCMLFPSWRVFLVFTSALTSICSLLFIKEFLSPKCYVLGILLLFLAGDKLIFFQYAAIRNALAINLFLLSIICINKGFNKKSVIVITCLIGGLFHNSAYIFIPMIIPFLFKLQFKGMSSFFFILGLVIFRSITNTDFVSNILSLFIFQTVDRYSYYLDVIDFGHQASYFLLVFMVLYTYSTLYVLSNNYNDFKRNEILIIQLSLLYSVAMALGPLGFRAHQYYSFFFILSPIVIFANNNIKKVVRYGIISIVGIYLIYSFFMIFLKNPEFPYEYYYSILDLK